MIDLRTALTDAAGDPGNGDVLTDLENGRKALRRQRATMLRRGVAGLGVAALVGVVVVQGLDDSSAPKAGKDDGDKTSQSPTNDGRIELMSKELAAGVYTFGLTPKGWKFQGETPYAALIIPEEGKVGESLDDYEGKILVSLVSADEPFPNEGDDKVTVDGRDFYLRGDSGYTTVTTQPVEGNPIPVHIQFPPNTPWDRDAMIEFVGSVRVSDDAQQGVG